MICQKKDGKYDSDNLFDVQRVFKQLKMVGESEPDKLFTAHRILHMAISGCRACAKEAFHTPSDLHLREARMGNICKSRYKDIFKKD